MSWYEWAGYNVILRYYFPYYQNSPQVQPHRVWTGAQAAQNTMDVTWYWSYWSPLLSTSSNWHMINTTTGQFPKRNLVSRKYQESQYVTNRYLIKTMTKNNRLIYTFLPKSSENMISCCYGLNIVVEMQLVAEKCKLDMNCYNIGLGPTWWMWLWYLVCFALEHSQNLWISKSNWT